MSTHPVFAMAHSLAISVMVYGYNGLTSMQGPTAELRGKQKGRYWQFLTIQALLGAVITMALSTVADMLPKNQTVIKAKRLFMMVSLPLSATVSILYWSLLIIAPSLVLQVAANTPKDSQSRPKLATVPLDIDIAAHLFPALVLLLDFYGLEKKYAQKQITFYAPLMSIAFAVWYGGFIEYLATFNHQFPYPFLECQFGYRVAIYTGAAALSYASLRFLNLKHPGKPIFRDYEESS